MNEIIQYNVSQRKPRVATAVTAFLIGVGKPPIELGREGLKVRQQLCPTAVDTPFSANAGHKKCE